MMDPLLSDLALQSCSSALDCWAQAEFFDAFLKSLKTVAPLEVFTLMFSTGLYLGLYLWTQDHTVPIVTILLMGGAMLPILPASAARLAWIAILFAGGMALFALLWVVIR